MGTWICLFSVLGFLCLSPLRMGFFYMPLGMAEHFFQRLGLEFQDILLMGMGFRNKLRWENGIWIPPFQLKLIFVAKQYAGQGYSK